MLLKVINYSYPIFLTLPFSYSFYSPLYYLIRIILKNIFAACRMLSLMVRRQIQGHERQTRAGQSESL